MEEDLVDAHITPYVLYRDAAAALGWLAEALGFKETLRFTTDDGRVSHAEMELDGAEIMIGEPGPDYRNPKDTGVTVLLHVQTDAVDERFRRAVDAGAAVVREPADQTYGQRNCAVADPEGHQWWFSQPL